MRALGFLIFFGVGIFQLAAVIAGVEHWTGLSGFVAVILALLVNYIPLLGQVLGIAGAVKGWGWEWWQAALLFFGGLLFPLIIGGGGFLLEILSAPFKRKTGELE